MFNQKGVIKNFARKSPVTDSLFNKVLTFFLITYFLKTLTRVFFVSFMKFLRTPVLQNTSGRLLLNRLHG